MKIKDVPTKLIEVLANCNISKNHTGRWGVIFGKHSRTYSFMDEDKQEVLKWIQNNYDRLIEDNRKAVEEFKKLEDG